MIPFQYEAMADHYTDCFGIYLTLTIINGNKNFQDNNRYSEVHVHNDIIIWINSGAAYNLKNDCHSTYYCVNC